MNVILLERVNNLGDLGDEVSVKAGFARNFLLPKKKAVQANDANRAVFEERRKELAKLAATYAENAKIAIRNVRKDGMDKIKKFRNEGMSEDESQIWIDEIQTMTDKMTLSIENLQKEKQSEIVTF